MHISDTQASFECWIVFKLFSDVDDYKHQASNLSVIEWLGDIVTVYLGCSQHSAGIQPAISAFVNISAQLFLYILNAFIILLFVLTKE